MGKKKQKKQKPQQKDCNKKNSINLSKLLYLLKKCKKLNCCPLKKKGCQDSKEKDNKKDPFDMPFNPSDYARPEKGDKLFIEPSNDNYSDKAIIGRFGKNSDYLIITGFYEIALTSIRMLKTKGIGEKDTQIYPILYNFRHYLELILKQTIRNFRLINREISDDEVGYTTGHSLKNLWETLKRYLYKIENENFKDRETNAFEILILELDSIDAESFAFRYHCDGGKSTHDKIKLTIPKEMHISLDNLEKVMIKIHNYIDGISSLSYAQLDSIQDAYESPDIIYP
ncbi:hypothetical protein LJC06_02480 [Bacteroidales bacterium OttesenSCG-928-I14]|nr:hypothetical protein [Bacteroidales bacterium OttesenSCG-928-I14]